jgi:hypothetical protein
MTLFAGSATLLAAVFAVTRFDQPMLWTPLLIISQHPFWHGVYSLRVHQQQSGSMDWGSR